MIFNNGYYHPLDREYGQVWHPDVKEVVEPIEEPIGAHEPSRFTTQDIGSSAAMMQPGAETLKSRIWHGVSRVELAFMGAGKGSKEGLTPESYGKEERQAMRDLARINDVKVSTHASVAVGGLAGYSNQQNLFSESGRKFALEEIKRAIDFAADASTGGAVVVHTGEFPRSIGGYYGDKGVKKGKAKFTGYEDEEQEAIYYLVDDHSGRIITGVKEDQIAWVPKKREKGKKFLMVPDSEKKRLKEMKFEMVQSYLDELKAKSPELYNRAEERFGKMLERVPYYDMDPDGNIQVELLKFKDFKEREEFRRPDGRIDTKKAAIAFFTQMQEAELHRALGSARQFEEHYIDGVKERDHLENAWNFFSEFNNATDEKSKQKLMQKMGFEISNISPHKIGGRIFGKTEEGKVFLKPNAEQEFKELFSRNEREIAYGRESSSAGRLQAREIQDRILHAQDIEDYGVKKSAQTLADAGMFAMEKTKITNRNLKKQGMQKIDPIYIAPENIFQETFGSHPQELKQIITRGRRVMIKKLVKKGFDKSEAEDLAKKHISGTFDIGHANIWKKYYKYNENKSPEENEKAFSKWVVDQAKDLVKGGFVKHIHIADNLGFHDEHLAVGQGTAPIKELMKELEKEGLKDIIIEPGSTNFQTMWPDSMRALGSPIYAAEAPYHSKFDQLHQTYAGQTAPPYFLVGQSVPSEEWRLWSQVPLE